MSNLRRWSLVGLSILALAGAVCAQTVQTAPRAPGPAPAPAPAPVPTDAAPPPPEVKAAPALAPVQEQSLQSLDLFSPAGRATGLPSTLWRGASASLARREIPALANHPTSLALTVLAWRVLSTGANAPKGAGEDAGLAGARVRALLALGDLKAASAIVAHTPNLAADPVLAQAAADVDLLAGRADQACALLDSLAQGRELPYFVRLRAFCLAEAGKMNEAQLALDLASQGPGKDAVFARLLGAEIAGVAPTGMGAADTPLNLALSRKLKLDLSAAVADAAPAALESLATDATQAPETRWAAAYRGLRLGVVSADAALATYTTAPAAPATPAPDVPPQRKARPHLTLRPTPAQALASAAANEAEAVRQLAAAPDAAARVLAINVLVGRAGAEAAGPARLAQKALAAINPEGLAPRDRLMLARTAVLAGNLKEAERFRLTLKTDEPDAVSAVDLALADAMISAGHGKADRAVLDRLVDRGAMGDRACQAAAAILAGLADPGAGEIMGEEARAQFASFDIGPSGPAARMLALDGAADAGVLGDVALFALESGREGPLRPADRARIVHALAKTGDRRDAALTALEGLAALGGK